MPVSNLWSETSRLRLGGRGVPHIVNHHPPNYPVGHEDTFWVLNVNTDKYDRERATIACETPHLYLYVEHGVSYSRSQACRSARRFEKKIYPEDRRVFGSEWTPGVDDDRHVTVYFGNLQGVAGYFSGEDEYPTIVNRYSNQREIMFIDASSNPLASAEFYSTIAHEFQHMIHWHMHAQDEAWSNEGSSMLAQVLNGYSADGDDETYAEDPVQLDSWTDGDSSPNYGAGFLWMDYLNLRFGNRFTHAMLSDSRYSGLDLARDVLKKLHTHDSLSDVFGDWAVANYVNDRSLGRRFSYSNSSIHTSIDLHLPAGSSNDRRDLKPYLPYYVGIKNTGRSRTIHFSGARSMPLISASDSGRFWWSNRCDFCDTSMTRTLDLRHTRNPILTFSTWFRIESGYDYAYVEVSTNGGKSWQTLKTKAGTETNPNGANFGNGLTGSSQSINGAHNGWVPIKADLHRFAGRRVKLRFEYITDDEYNEQGWAIRDVAVRAAHFSDLVGSTAWSLRGFVPVKQNRLPVEWGLRLIQFGSSHPTIHSISLRRGATTIHISAEKHAARSVIVVYAQAPKSTDTTTFTLAG